MLTEVALLCLSLNVYWEARNQSVAGQVAVAQVTLNRVASDRFPNDVCEVVYQRHQFSWYWDGKSDKPTDQQAWEQAQHIAQAVSWGSVHADLKGVLFYHAVYSKPYWAKSFQYVAQIGDHKFYR